MFLGIHSAIFLRALKNMLRVYILPVIVDEVRLPFLVGQSKGKLFQTVEPKLYEDILDIVDTPEDGDYILCPHDYSILLKYPDKVVEYERFALSVNKKIIIFYYSDSSQIVDVENSIVFRSSQYRKKMRKNEIIMPAYIDDIGQLPNRDNSDDRLPSVGFVGRAGFSSWRDRIKSYIKYLYLRGPEIDGRNLRRKLIAFCRASRKIHCNFIIRSSYSGNVSSIEVDPAVARAEYKNNLAISDFILCPKGDGNYSLRFYETLAAGRVPVVVDTDMPLPLENIIDYKKCCIIVEQSRIKQIPALIELCYKNQSQESFRSMQQTARAYFEMHLTMPSFLKKTLDPVFLKSFS